MTTHYALHIKFTDKKNGQCGSKPHRYKCCRCREVFTKMQKSLQIYNRKGGHVNNVVSYIFGRMCVQGV